MKKLLAILLAGLMLITSMSVMAWADDDNDDGPYEIMRAGLVFDSVNDLVSYIDKLDDETANALNSYGDVMKYLYYDSPDGIWLPDGISFSEIEEIEVTAKYVTVYIEHDGIDIQFYSFTSVDNGKDFTKQYIGLSKNSGNTIALDDGIEVYYTCHILDSYYCFIQDDSYYLLMRTRTDYEEEMLEYCNAAYHSFSEVYNLAGESSDGKVKLSWDKLSDDETYTVYYKRSGSDEWKVAGTTSKHKANISGLRSGISYDFKIEAAGIESEIVSVTSE